MLSVRNVLIGLAVAFTAYLGVRGLLGLGSVESPLIIIATLAVYVAGTWVCLLVQRPGEARSARVEQPVHATPASRLPLGAAIAALFVAAVVPTGIALGVGESVRAEPFATWYIGGIGALMTIVMVRRRPWFAWAGMVLLTAACSAWIGLLLALALGLVGSLMWVTAAQLLVYAIDRAVSDTERLAELQQAASAWQASQAGRQRERRVQVQRALALAGPVLTRVVRSGGHLDEEGRASARLAEGRLRDELRGPRLLDDDVRAALEAARRRGATVTMLDEGGLDDLDADALRVIRAELADTIRGSTSRRLYIRTAPHDSVAVTVVGREEATGTLSDDDSVDLWREIPRPNAAAPER
ncbi:MAG: hypothetical protein QM611_12385 [Microbacterium sp.]|uniref:hypothetical protein n=1 Tax=Microbacterium sp. TaxID=51671 RepID=UPI0039E344AF